MLAMVRWLGRTVETSVRFAMNNICQLSSLVSTIAAAGAWIVRFGSPTVVADFGPGLLAAVCMTALLAIHALRWLKPGVGELTLAFATYVVHLWFMHGGLSSVGDMENLCGILLGQWGLSYILERVPTTRIARAFGPAAYRISFCGLSVLFGLFAIDWMAQHFGTTNVAWPTSLLMVLWGLDASRRTGSGTFAAIAWGMLFVYVSAVLTHWLGPVVASAWWMLAWTVTGLVLLGVRQILISRSGDEMSVFRQRLVAWLAPLGVMLPLLFAMVGAGSLLSLGWPQRIAGVLALCGMLAARQCRLPLNPSGLFLPLLNWQLLAACAAGWSGMTGLVADLTRNDLAACGLPIAAFAAISVWCFESRRLRKPISSLELIVVHQIFLLGLMQYLLVAAAQSNPSGIWTTINVIWAAVAWGATAGAAFAGAVRTQNRDLVWWGQAALLVAVGYFTAVGVLSPTVPGTAYVLLLAGLGLWCCGRCTEAANRFAILSQPFQQTGYWLPMTVLPLAVLTQWNDAGTVWAGANSLPLLCAAAFYFWRGMEKRQLGTAILSAVMLNVACLFLWKDLHWTDPQLFLMPIGICVLGLTELMNREIPAKYHNRLRFIGSLMILVSPVFRIVTGSWLHILTLMVASAVLALAAIGLRIRTLLYTSTAFLLADLVALVTRGSMDEPNVLWIAGVLLGASIIALGAVCENHRETVLARLRGLAAELEQWA